MSATHMSSMDPAFTKMCCVHVPAMIPKNVDDLEVDVRIQCAGLLGIGLLFAQTNQRMMTEILMGEVMQPSILRDTKER